MGNEQIKDNVISMETIKEKLRNLRQYMPDEQSEVFEFAAYLANSLNSELAPAGFCLSAALALYDLEKGVDGFTNSPIRNNLVGYPSIIYRLLMMKITDIAKAVCPEPFAKSVMEFYTEVYQLREILAGGQNP